MEFQDNRSCLVCFENSSRLEDLSTSDAFEKTILDKIQFIMNCDIVIYEGSCICKDCLKELNQAYEFRIKLESSLQYWSEKYDIKEDKYIVIDIENEETEFDFVEPTNENEPENDCENIENHVIYNKKESFEAMSTFQCYRCKIVFQTAAELLHHKCFPLKIDKQKKSKTTLKKANIKIKSNVKIQSSTDLKKHICTICNEAFRRPHHLLEHSTKHTGERNFKCNFCEKTFQRLSSVSRHMKSHDALPGQKAKKSPFLCTICGKNFPYSNAMQRHMRMHKGIKPHQCQICTKRFSQMAHLKVHMRSHTGEKPFVCDECGVAFKFNQTLQKHLSNHHERKSENLEITSCIKIESEDEEIPKYNMKFC